MLVNRFDHVVLTVASIDATVDFYTRVLGMKAMQTFKLDYMDEVVVAFGSVT